MLLDRSMLDNNRFQPNLESHPVNQTISNIVDILQLQAQFKKVKIEFEKLHEEIVLELDLLRLQQVVINLISNAVKFSKTNQAVLVRIKLKEAKSSDDVELQVEVIDTGIGIPETELPYIFQPYFKSTDPNGLAKNRYGNGLGLSICQRIMT